jgi:hypothetical protein
MSINPINPNNDEIINGVNEIIAKIPAINAKAQCFR